MNYNMNKIEYISDGIIENHNGLLPKSYIYQLKDTDFVAKAEAILKKHLNLTNIKLNLFVDYDNNITLYGEDIILERIFGAKLKQQQLLNKGYYISKYVLEKMFNGITVHDCSATYRSVDGYNIVIQINCNKHLPSSLSEEDLLRYEAINKQIEILEKKKMDLFLNL